MPLIDKKRETQMQITWQSYYTKEQTLRLIKDMGLYLNATNCNEELPKKGKALWIVPPGAKPMCVTKSGVKGMDGRLLYHVALWSN